MGQDFFIIPDGFRFLIPLFVFGALAVYFQAYLLTLAILSFFLFVAWFFRNPHRVAPTEENVIISPADGIVIKIEEIEENDLLKAKSKVICIFMNVFNVHVNRNICSGAVESVRYYPGKFLVASLDKVSLLNERNAIVIKRGDGVRLMVVQIAGLVARRIACWIKAGDEVVKGERFGLIRFGSRLDVYLPADAEVLVKAGDKVRAGTSIIGKV